MVSVQKMAQELAEETVEANETEKGACRSQYLQQSLTAMFWMARNANIEEDGRLPHAHNMSDITSHKTTTGTTHAHVLGWRCITAVYDVSFSCKFRPL